MQKKICLLGGFAVGKTSLVSRYVHSIFSDRYLTTIGVKIEKKRVAVDASTVDLIIWDIYGQDDFQEVRQSYLRGASGYFLVVDGTRRSTLDTAVALQGMAEQALGRAPFVLVLNKADLADGWEVDDDLLEPYVRKGWPVVRTSAKTGADVDNAFERLARAMLT